MILDDFLAPLKKVIFRAFARLQDGALRDQCQQSLGLLKRCGDRVYLAPTALLYGAENIEIGNDTSIQANSRLQAVGWYGQSGQRFHPKLTVGMRCFIEFNVHIGACYQVKIGNDVMIASGVYISDHQHRYDDPKLPISLQPLTQEGYVVIGDGTFIGEGACIFSKVNLGEHVVVGANAVVTKDVPAFCVVAGVPARILRHYDFKQEAWIAGAPVTRVTRD